MNGKTIMWLFVSQAFSNSIWLVNYVNRNLEPMLVLSIICLIILVINAGIDSWET